MEERQLDMLEVGGSKPSPPTILDGPARLVGQGAGLSRSAVAPRHSEQRDAGHSGIERAVYCDWQQQINKAATRRHRDPIVKIRLRPACRIAANSTHIVGRQAPAGSSYEARPHNW